MTDQRTEPGAAAAPADEFADETSDEPVDPPKDRVAEAEVKLSRRQMREALATAEAAEAAQRAFEEGRIAARGRALERAHSLGDVPLRNPAGGSGLLEVFNHKHLMSLMVKRELRQRYLGSKMGLAWSYINPAVRFFTFYFVFGIILGRGNVPHFAIHLFAGMVIVNYFNDTFSAGSRSIIGNKSIINKMPLPRQLYPVASMLVSAYHVGPQLVVLVIACLATGTWRPTVTGMIAMVMAFAIIVLLATGMGVMFAAVSVLYRDFTRVVQIFTNMLPFTVPMMYPYSLVTLRFGSGWPHTLYMDNPVVYAVLLMQRAFWYPSISAADAQSSRAGGSAFQLTTAYNFPAGLFATGALMIVVCFVFLIFCTAVFARLDDKLPDRMST